MNSILMMQSAFLKALGMSMIHSVWEGGLVLLPVLILLSLIRKEKARWRYLVLYSGLMAMLILFVLTFLHIFVAAYPHDATGTAEVRLSQPGILSPFSLPSPRGTVSQTGSLIARLMASLDPVAAVLALIWIAGFLITGTRLARGLYTSQVFVRRRTFEPDLHLIKIFEKVRQSLNVPALIRLKMSAKKISPMVAGIIKPVVIVPIAALANLSPSQTEAILAHELAHIKRLDHLFLLVQELARLILFFHPLTWYLSNGINREREHCCDDLVLKTYTDPIDYIKALTMIQEMNLAGMNAANAVLNKPGRLLNRIRRLIRPQRQTALLPRLAAVFILLLSAGILLATTFRKPVNTKPSSSLSAFAIPSYQPDDSNYVEVMVNIDTDDARQDTSIIMISRRINVSEGEDGSDMTEMQVRMANDSIVEITVNGKPVPPGEYQMYADSIKVLRGGLKAPDSKYRIIRIDTIGQDPDNIRKEIEVIIENKETSDMNNTFMDFNGQYYLSQLIQPDTGRYGEYIRQEYLDRYEEYTRQQVLEQLKKVQEQTRLLQEEAAKRAAEQARKQAELAREQAEVAREQMKKAMEQMEDVRAEQEAARQELQEKLKTLQQETNEKVRQQLKDLQQQLEDLYNEEDWENMKKEMQDLMKNLRQQDGDSLLYLPNMSGDLEVFAPFSDSFFVFPLPQLPETPGLVLPPVPQTGEPFYYPLPPVPQTGEPFYYVLPEISSDDESISDPAKMEELNATLKDLEK